MSRKRLFLQSLYEAAATLIAGHVLLICTFVLFPLSRLRDLFSSTAEPRTILIIGAGSGVGYDISVKYASRAVNLVLVDSIDQSTVVKDCRNKKANVITLSFDMNNLSRLKTSLKAIDLEYKVDLIVLCKFEDWYSFGYSRNVTIQSIGESLLSRNSNDLNDVIQPILDGKRVKLLLITSSSAQAFGISGSVEYAAAHASLYRYAMTTNNASIVSMGSVASDVSLELGLDMEISTSGAANLCTEVVSRGIKFIALPLKQSIALCFAGNLFSDARARLARLLSTEYRRLRL